jgi:hypothetical protein
MKSITAWFVFSLMASVKGLPPSPVDGLTIEVVKRNPCDGVSALPQLYRNYTEADCPAVWHMGSDGKCGQWNNYYTSECVTFCQFSKSLDMVHYHFFIS